LPKDGFVIPEAVIENTVLGKIKEFWISAFAGMTTKFTNSSLCNRLDSVKFPALQYGNHHLALQRLAIRTREDPRLAFNAGVLERSIKEHLVLKIKTHSPLLQRFFFSLTSVVYPAHPSLKMIAVQALPVFLYTQSIQ
jgi:hypothetical protein